MKNNTVITRDTANRKVNVTRDFEAPIEKVWKAWTDPVLLDKWWAPKPWKAVTKTMDFRPGGLWLYYMAGPEGEKFWSRADFKEIEPGVSFSHDCRFCDENGIADSSSPLMRWHVIFKATANGTLVDVTLTFDNDADFEKLIQMGFEGGFTMGLNNLDELLEA
ncbi:SRPBCC domain-containing protein [uncultured Mucilaginibacter sp.]|uniref:SRPBCC family protein n=1 Tax=uncultured Mucilaginibacter sp. TaxID=797541 RepID=UPI0025DDFC25|nr:SRPBCC domain-containing protein [uncultured Mucilaginibacter sp.]